MSRELDARVAEAMGWRFWKTTRGEYTLCVRQKPGDTEPWTKRRSDEPSRYEECSADVATTIGFFGEGAPRYSTDPAACEEVIERIGTGYLSVDNGWRDDGYGGRVGGWHAEVVCDGGTGKGNSRVLWTAICLAFLAAVEGEKGAKQ